VPQPLLAWYFALLTWTAPSVSRLDGDGDQVVTTSIRSKRPRGRDSDSRRRAGRYWTITQPYISNSAKCGRTVQMTR
jgi:hypothetical protein